MAKLPYSVQVSLLDLLQTGQEQALEIPSEEDAGIYFILQAKDGVLTVKVCGRDAPEPRLKLNIPDTHTIGKKLADRQTFGERMNETRERTFKKNKD